MGDRPVRPILDLSLVKDPATFPQFLEAFKNSVARYTQAERIRILQDSARRYHLKNYLENNTPQYPKILDFSEYAEVNTDDEEKTEDYKRIHSGDNIVSRVAARVSLSQGSVHAQKLTQDVMGDLASTSQSPGPSRVMEAKESIDDFDLSHWN